MSESQTPPRRPAPGTSELRGAESPSPHAANDPRLRPLEGKPPGSLLIHEIYRSIQGESTYAGLPCVFIRLTACQLRCTYCDTPHAFTQGRLSTLDEVTAEALAFREPLIEVTGGEPLLQPEVFPLMARLCDAGATVLVETGGALDIGPVDPRVRVILDIKTPGSGEAGANFWPNLDRLKPVDEVKVVVCDREDFDWAVDVVRRHQLLDRVPVLISPSFGSVKPDELASWVLGTGLPLRLQIQLHKILWEPDRRGV